LVAYALGITDIDPIPYNLLFERFLNPERVSMPDIDTDFCQDRRGEVIEYASQKYGKFNVAQVITFGSLLAKGVLRDVARVLGVPYAKADAMAKLIPEKLGIKLAEAFEQEEKIRELVASDPLSAKVWEYGLALEGLKRNAGTHAAGIVISNEELWHKAPLYRPSGEDAIVCGYDGRFLEDVDLIKFDFLGLKTLTVVDNAVKLIEKIHGVKIDMVTLDVNDPKVYETIRSGQTKGLFQIESSGMQNLAMRLKPSNFEDIIAMVALYRPGPMDAGMLDDFVDRKHGKKEVSFMFAELEPILSPTYGVIVYQEQVMQIVQTIGGFSLGEADVIRRAMGKKQIEYMQQKKSQFADGAAAQGMDGAKAAELFDLIEKFAGYGFNKSHSAAYALITFYTAWLKTYYTTEFMAALLTSEQDKTEKVVKYIDELKHLDIVLAPPSVQKSQLVFSTSKEGEVNTIHFGLGAIKGVGEGAAQGIIDARNEGGEFSDLADFLSRIDTQKANKKILEALIKSGALDSFGHSRKALLGDIDKIVAFGQDSTRAKKNAENSLFGDASEMVKFEIVINDAPEYALLDILDLEKESLGFYISGHPLDPFREELEKINYTMSTDLDQVADGSDLLLAGVVGELVTKINKKGNKYMIAPLMDFHGTTELMLFERDSKKIEAMDLTRPLVVRANVSKNENFIRLNIKKILTLEEAMKEKVETKIEEKPSEPLIVSLNVTSAIDDLEKLYMLVRAHPGNRDLHVWIKAKLQEVRIETKLRVSDEIVEKLVELGFIDLAA
jgi:DNA polymerase-3 subunit alpha